MLNLTPLMERLTIKKKDLQVEQWSANEPFAWAQNALLAEIERQYNLGLPVRIIVLKGRQLGISTASEGVLFNWCFLQPGAQSLVIAHETKATQIYSAWQNSCGPHGLFTHYSRKSTHLRNSYPGKKPVLQCQ